MVRKLAQTGLVALVMVGTALAGGLPAQAAQVRPGSVPDEFAYTYYSNAQRTTVVGYREYGACGTSQEGTETAYFTINEYDCP